MSQSEKTRSYTSRAGVLRGDARELAHIVSGESHEPHRILGAHPVSLEGQSGVVVRAFHPDAVAVECVVAGAVPTTGVVGSERAVPTTGVVGSERAGTHHASGGAIGGRGPDSSISMEIVGKSGLFATFVPGATLPLAYRLRFQFADGVTWERDDAYRFLPTIGDVDLHLFNEGSHRKLWEKLGAHVRTIDDVTGVSFAVWAPNAKRVSVVGDFCGWDGRLFQMRQMGSSGVWELFVPGLSAGCFYKYELKTQAGDIRIKADPYAQACELPPGTASRVYEPSHAWNDADWMAARATRDHLRSPIAIYEVHLGSWMRGENNRFLNYREIAPKLVEHVKRFGFTHIEPLPLAEHPFGGSWGYQVTGYYAPTSRFGTPDDFRWFIDYCHQNGIGVIVDWVPAHFPKDDFALRRYDGTALYEHEDPRLGEHPDWGTLIFNYGRPEVRNFLIANALYWLSELHVDGLRVDAVASMLYLDYSRKDGQWIANKYGGRENLDAISFLRNLNETIRLEAPGAIMVAEESTAWGGVTRPAGEGGLGFTFKWNMGWMHDTLLYFSKDPAHRKYHHHDLTFAMIYEHSERFIMPLSHDEVVHGKGPLLCKMPGDLWRQFANLRALLAYQYTRPGKKLLFQGTELAPWYEWYYDAPLDWTLVNYPERAALQRFMEDLGKLYLDTPTLWRNDPDSHSYCWIDCNDYENSVFSFFRRDGEQHVVVVMNLTPVPRPNYRVGVPVAGRWIERFNSDNLRYGGGDYPTFKEPHTDAIAWHSQAQSVNLNLPPLGVLVLSPG